MIGSIQIITNLTFSVLACHQISPTWYNINDILLEVRPLLLLPLLLSRPCRGSFDELFLLRPASSLPQDPEYSVTKMEANFSDEDFVTLYIIPWYWKPHHLYMFYKDCAISIKHTMDTLTLQYSNHTKCSEQFWLVQMSSEVSNDLYFQSIFLLNIFQNQPIASAGPTRCTVWSVIYWCYHVTTRPPFLCLLKPSPSKTNCHEISPTHGD
jgi:hypothetical protein